MPAWKPPSDSVLARAAAIRAEGGDWEAAAKEVGRSPHTVRKWPLMYPERWGDALRAAVRRVTDDAAVEGVVMLRQLLRTAGARLRERAAWHLLYRQLELQKAEIRAAALLPAPPPSQAHLIAAFVEGQSRETLLRLAAHAARMFNARVPECHVLPAHDSGGGV